MLKAWIFLILAILAELAGTISMNASGTSGSMWHYGLMYTLIGVSYFFLSFAVKKIPIAIAFAIWDGLGIALITEFSFFFLKNKISTQEMVGLGIAIVGIVMLNFGEQKTPKTIQ